MPREGPTLIHKRQGIKFLMPDGWQEKIDKSICPVCSKPNKRQWRTCSTKCTVEFWKHAYWSSKLRDKCFERDNYKCVNCRQKGGYERENDPLEEIKARKKRMEEKFKETGKQLFKDMAELQEEDIKSWKPKEWITTSGGLEADHIIPIALGGNEYDLKNLQTLCERCHKRKTAREGKEFAKARKGIKTTVELINEGKQNTLWPSGHGRCDQT